MLVCDELSTSVVRPYARTGHHSVNHEVRRVQDPRSHHAFGRPRSREKEPLVICLLILAVAASAAVVLFLTDRHAFLYFGDSASHLVKAREFIDSQHPGLKNISTVWLPLPHILLFPFAMVDALFYTGIAAPVIGIPMLVLTALLLHGIVDHLTGSKTIALLGALVYGLNPNIIYMALTPMSETASWLFTAAGGYAITRWVTTEKSRWLFLTSVAVVLATLCRYEAWLLAPFVALLGVTKDLAIARKGNRKEAMRAFWFGALSFAGILLWLVWNRVGFGDPFMFAHETYAAGVREPAGSQPVILIGIVARALLNIYGPVLLLLCMAAVVCAPRALLEYKTGIVLLFFLMPTLFILAALAGGYVQVNAWGWNWRYVLAMSFFVVLTASVGIAEVWRRFRSGIVRGVVVVGLAFMPLAQTLVPSVGVATFQEAAGGFIGETRRAVAFGERLPSLYAGGTIALVCPYGLGHRIMLCSGLPLKTFSILPNPAETGITPAWPDDRYIVIGVERSPESAALIDNWYARRDSALHRYSVCVEDSGYTLLTRQ